MKLAVKVAPQNNAGCKSRVPENQPGIQRRTLLEVEGLLE
jgi:hypothetical protein